MKTLINTAFDDRELTIDGAMLALRRSDAAVARYPGPGDKRITAYVTLTGARQLIDELEKFAAPPAPEPLPPIDVAEVLDASLLPRYEIAFSWSGGPFVRSTNKRTYGIYTKAEAERRAAAEEKAMNGTYRSTGEHYRYIARPEGSA